MKSKLLFQVLWGVSFALILVLLSTYQFGIGINTAHADSTNATKKCVWSYISDGGSPELGNGGVIEMDEDWEKMSKGGWRLITVNTNFNYVFEKCE